MREFTISCPISKIDEDQRIVYGYATVEEIDSQGDIVDYEASKRAFPEWAKVGNIREMHDKTKAVGKNFDVQFDDGKKAVLIGAKISESADGENAWIKVKEGILTGFSIGGRVNQIAAQTVKVKDEDVQVKRIMDYDLSEVSLVDNPAAPSAKLVMVKRADGVLQPAEVMERAADPHSDQWFRKYYQFGAGKAMIEKLNSSYAKNMKGQTMKKADDTKPADEKAPATPVADEAAAAKAPAKDEVKVNKPGDKVEEAPVDTGTDTQTTGDGVAHEAPQVTTAQHLADANNPNGEGTEDLQPGPDNDGKETPNEHPVKTTTEAAAQEVAGDPVKPGEPVQADSQTTTPKPDVAVPTPGEGGAAEEAKAAVAILQKADFGKSMFGVAQLASLIDGLQWLRDCEKAEAAQEGDGSSIPQKLTDAIKNLGSILTEFATEEAAEAAEGRDLTDEFAYSKDTAGLAKAVAIAVAEALQKVTTPKTDDSKLVAESLTKVSDTISSIDERLKRIESSPVGKSAVRYQDVHKGGNGGEPTKDAQIDALIEKGKNAKTAEERGDILMEIRRVQHS